MSAQTKIIENKNKIVCVKTKLFYLCQTKTSKHSLIMKSQVFKNAWKLVRNLGITLGLALSIAWAEAKINKLSTDLTVAQGIAFNYQTEKAITKQMAALSRKVNDIKPCAVRFVERNANGQIIVDNSGARFDYGVGKYNAD